MPEEDAPRVFERFFRADPARTRTSGGSGLGLSIVSAIVTAHGGTVTATSKPGEGLVVTVLLPVSGLQAGVEPLAAVAPPSSPS
jgi:signal transduction histidine kinase